MFICRAQFCFCQLFLPAVQPDSSQRSPPNLNIFTVSYPYIYPFLLTFFHISKSSPVTFVQVNHSAYSIILIHRSAK